MTDYNWLKCKNKTIHGARISLFFVDMIIFLHHVNFNSIKVYESN
jgi:hypothetical protein